MRALAELLEADVPLSHQRFIERLGQTFDLADSIKISAVHEQVTAVAAPPASDDKQAVKEEYQRVRAAIERSARQSFVVTDDNARMRFPQVRAEMTLDEAMAVESYLVFYGLPDPRPAHKHPGRTHRSVSQTRATGSTRRGAGRAAIHRCAPILCRCAASIAAAL